MEAVTISKNFLNVIDTVATELRDCESSSTVLPKGKLIVRQCLSVCEMCLIALKNGVKSEATFLKGWEADLSALPYGVDADKVLLRGC